MHVSDSLNIWKESEERKIKYGNPLVLQLVLNYTMSQKRAMNGVGFVVWTLKCTNLNK